MLLRYVSYLTPSVIVYWRQKLIGILISEPVQTLYYPIYRQVHQQQIPFQDIKGAPVDVSFEVVIEDPGPDQNIPVTLPNTPNDILFGFGGDDVINGDAGGDPDDPGNDIIFGDGLAPNDAGADGNDLLNGEGGNDIVFGGGANDSLFGADGADIMVGDYFLGLNVYEVNFNPNDFVKAPLKDFLNRFLNTALPDVMRYNRID